ncbi:tellurium resistance protein [Paenirhodobacter sp.]|uniref:SLAC1 family transporter n=1 Tax=Paenirhodobacter sp. TaxID=1965326 RepID=UPI003B3E0A33
MRLAPMKPTPRGLWRRTPPAIFPPTLGLLALGLGWRRAMPVFGLPQGLAEAVLGAVTLLALFALLAYAAKILRRPAAALEDLRILPGRAGLSAAVLCLYLIALALAPYGAGRAVFWAGVCAHLALTAAMAFLLATGPAEQRRVTPVWHLTFTGWIVAALAAQGLGLWALPLFWVGLVAAGMVWALSLAQFLRESVPAPLRPLLAIHLAPAAVLGTVAQGLGAAGAVQTFALLSAFGLAVLLLGARWLLAARFTPLWGAFSFPLAATAGFWIAHGWTIAGGLLLVAATGAILPLALRIYRMWADGQLAVKTNAAIA